MKLNVINSSLFDDVVCEHLLENIFLLHCSIIHFPAFLCLDDHHREKNTIKNLIQRNLLAILFPIFSFISFSASFSNKHNFPNECVSHFFLRLFYFSSKLLRMENMRRKIFEWLYFILFNYLHYDTKLHFTLVGYFNENLKRNSLSKGKPLKFFISLPLQGE